VRAVLVKTELGTKSQQLSLPGLTFSIKYGVKEEESEKQDPMANLTKKKR